MATVILLIIIESDLSLMWFIVVTGDGHYFQWTPKHRRKKPVVLHHVNKNIYRHKDHNGKNHYLQVGKIIITPLAKSSDIIKK